MGSTYLDIGGAERERVITEIWQLLLQRKQENGRFTLDDLDAACQQICPSWQDDPMSIAAALTARAYGAIEEALAVIKTIVVGKHTIQTTKLGDLLNAYACLKHLDELSKTIVEQDRCGDDTLPTSEP